jgi:hypothetical protein
LVRPGERAPFSSKQKAQTRRLCRAFADEMDPLDGERFLSAMHGAMWTRRRMVEKIRADWAMALGAPVAREIARVGGPGAKAVLTTFAWLDGGQFGALCEELADAMAGVEAPSWTTRIGAGELVRASSDRKPGDGEIISIEVRRQEGYDYSLAVYINELTGGTAKHLHVLQSLDNVNNSELALSPIKLAHACRRVADAIELTDRARKPALAEGYADTRAFVLARLRPVLASAQP